jgi:hypothetical protein
MDAYSFSLSVVLCVAGTTFRHHRAIANSRAGRERNLLKRATRAARNSEIASQTCGHLSNRSIELSGASGVVLGAARQARDEQRLLQFVCLYLYGKWMFYCAGCLLGWANAKLRDCAAILNRVERGQV